MLDFHAFQKGNLWTTFSYKVSALAVTFSWFGRPCRDPAFHETIVITVPFGPNAFLRRHFFDDDLLMFRFVCFSLCYVLCVIFITFVDKTTVNAQPLSPPIFEKIAPHLKNNVCSYFSSLRLRFRFCFFSYLC